MSHKIEITKRCFTKNIQETPLSQRGRATLHVVGNVFVRAGTHWRHSGDNNYPLST